MSNTTNLYYCPKCNGIVQRESSKEKIKSVCDETGKVSTLIKINDSHEVAVRFRRKFLKNIVELNSFNRKERLILKIVFERGVQFAYNSLKLLK